MELKELGRTGVKIPAIGIGTWKLGSDTYADIMAMKEGFRLGMKFIDTAEMYKTEGIVRDAIKGESVFVATKVSPHHLHYDGVIRACDESLKTLGVKCIDLYQIHWPNKTVPIKETMKAMEKLVEDGKIKYIGVSNFSVKEFEDAQSALKSQRIVSNQVEYSILVRNPEHDLLDYCTKNKVTLIAYSPLARGGLFDTRYNELLSIMNSIGKKHGKTIIQVALNWLISKEPVVAIPKASNIDHMKENAGAGDFKLTKEEIEEINKVLYKFKHGSVAGRFGPILKSSSLPWHIYERFGKKTQD